MKIYPILKKRKSKKKTKWIYKLRNYPITRAGITANPLEMYNPVSLTTVPNNTLVTHNGLDFVGGDTDTYEFDFFTKVANSNLECPMKIVQCGQTTLNIPTGGWDYTYLENNQTNIDKIKSQDGTSVVANNIINNYIQQIMVEVDLTPLCNSVFGGSNSALKSALKSINADVWAMGSGSNAGVNTNGVGVRYWANDIVAWGGYRATNTSNVITKMSYSRSDSFTQYMINSTNKIYLLLDSQYSSDGVISSSVSLDYLKVTVQLNRVPDTVASIPVNLPKYFGVVVKGFSPMWDSNTSGSVKILLSLVGKTTGNKYYLGYSHSLRKFYLEKQPSAIDIIETNARTIIKNQVHSLMWVKQSDGNNVLYVLQNNGTMIKTIGNAFAVAQDNYDLYISKLDSSTSYNADSFLDNLTLIDLEKIGKSSGYTDAEATAILNGTASGFENSELFDISKVVLHANASRSGGVITLNANGTFQSSYLTIPVLPNNRYELKMNKIGSNVNGYIEFKQQYNNIKAVTESYLGLGQNDGSYSMTIVTSDKCNNVRLAISSTTIGTYTFSGISLKRKD